MPWLCGELSQYTDVQYEEAYRTLSLSRRQRIDRLHRDEDRRRSLLGELLLRELLRICGAADASVDCADTGRPFRRGAALHVSITHSGNYAACAVSEVPVGIDLELLLPVRAGLVRRVCCTEELAYVFEDATPQDTVADPSVLRRFYEVWTAKEAYLKQCGTGITVDLRSVNTLSLPRQFYGTEAYMLCIV